MTQTVDTRPASEATKIEQVRASTEVVASIEAAKRWPRDETAALDRLLRVCGIKAFALRAFWRYPVNGEMLTDVTIGFALEAARCWGNFLSGSSELDRTEGRSEMLAFAWDLESTTMRRTSFINPHSGYTDSPFDKAGNRKPVRELITVRDIRQNNQSAGSRVERQMILACLPEWYVELAKDECRKTLEKDESGKPIELRRREILAGFEDRYGIRRDALVAKLNGVPVDQWNVADIVQLEIIARSLVSGETTVVAEFGDRPAGGVSPTAPTADDLAGAKPAPDPADAAPTDAPTKAALNGLMAQFGELGLTGRAAEVRARRLRLAELLLPERGAPIESANDLTAAEVATLREMLAAETVESVTRRLTADADQTADADREQDRIDAAEPLAEDTAAEQDRLAAEADAVVEASGEDA